MSSTLVDETVPVKSAAAAASPFRLTVEADGLAVLEFDTPGEKVNKYSRSVMLEFDRVLDALAARTDVKALVLISRKPGIFIAGADVNEIATADRNTDPEFIRGPHRTFNKLANLPFPTVAAIDGACVGGGCETVLSMDWRLASDSPKTQIGLPEIKLGILPAWGGTTRLPRMIGLAGALDVILAGKVLDGKRAKRAGLVDEVVPAALLEEVARGYALRKIGTKKRSNAGPGGGPARVKEPTLLEKVLEGPGKSVVFNKARASVMKETKGHYPAPLAALAVVEKGFGAPFDAALEAEVEGVGTLIGTPTMRSLVGLFFRMEEVKKETGVEALGVGPVKPRKIGRVGVLGAGVMGGGIAQLAADRGLPVRMKDIKAEALALGYAQAARIWKEKLKKRRMTRAEFAGKMALLGGSLEYAGFETCDITIEAVLEKMAVKHAVLAEWEKVVPPTAIFASNTSTLPITEIAANAAHPERVVGMHFFNPVYKMPLVEVIYGRKTDPEVTATIFDLAKKMGKTPVVVKDSPGFLVNRILGPYIAEGARLVLEGVDFTAIDKAMRAFGMPVGPIELLDDVGIDVAAKASETLSKAWPDRMPQDPALEKLVANGRIGRKAKKGFYLYESERRGGPDPAAYSDLGLSSPSKNPNVSLSSSEIQSRLILPMINEAAYCLAEGVVASPAKLDLAMIFGTGFPPFRGGLCAHADALGAQAVVDGLQRLARDEGGRFAPAPLLIEMARTGKTFF